MIHKTYSVQQNRVRQTHPPFKMAAWFGLKAFEGRHIRTEYKRGCHGHDCMVVVFTTTYAISACHH
jgi:hypothetical protein